MLYLFIVRRQRHLANIIVLSTFFCVHPFLPVQFSVGSCLFLSEDRSSFSLRMKRHLLLLFIPILSHILGATQALDLISSFRDKMGQTISTTQFYLYGRKHFTQTGYLKHVSHYKTPAQSAASIRKGEKGADSIDLDGKVVIVTGANQGVGKELATYAAAKGARLYMLCRSKERAEKAREEIIGSTGNDNVEILLADVSELSQVRKVVTDLQGKENKVDVLVCNAGVLSNERCETSDGNELTFAAHLLGGSYLLSQLLLPQLKAAKDHSRVIFVSSGGMYNTQFPDWATATSSNNSGNEDGGVTNYDGQFAYAYAKRGQVVLAEHLTKSIPEVSWVSCHPGWVRTSIVDKAYGDSSKYLEPMRTPWEGSEGIAWLMGANKNELEGGAYYLDRKPQRKHLSGPFFSEGTFTKNSPEEVDEMVENLRKAAGL